VITVPATKQHVIKVMNNLSPQNAQELENLGLGLWEAFKRIKGFMQSGEATALLLGEEPCCVFGVVWDAKDYHKTWFIATEEYWKLGMVGVRHARKFLQQARRNGPLITGSASPHPEVERWFRLLGYEKMQEEGGVKWFKYA
jgi:hypothetical protein